MSLRMFPSCLGFSSFSVTDWVRSSKFWPSVGRIDNVYGDRNLICACPPIEEYAE